MKEPEKNIRCVWSNATISIIALTVIPSRVLIRHSPERKILKAIKGVFRQFD